MSMPALRELTVALTLGGPKYHLPRHEESFRLGGGCRHTRSPEFARQVGLLEVIGEICKRCYVTLPDAAQALWCTTALVAGHAAELESVRPAPEMTSWLGCYARYAARLAPGDEAFVDRELDRAAADAVLADDAAELHDAWRRVLADRAAFLEQCAAACPRIESFNGTRQAVERAEESPELAALEQVTADTGLSRAFLRAQDVRSVVCTTWLQAHSRGAGAARAARLADAAVARLLDNVRVRDVSVLPEPALTGGQFASPALWADAELAAWWPKLVAAACRRLEREFETQASASETRLLLINDWPLTHDRDAGVAYLAASARFGPALPYGIRRDHGYRAVLKMTATGPSYAVVVTSTCPATPAPTSPAAAGTSHAKRAAASPSCGTSSTSGSCTGTTAPTKACATRCCQRSR
ncbi:hypothetical protein [Streptomyces sp. NPDC050485]|uniref:hypothetical protein n=1 Tax=Streptomyces sp. NPDC050485 TaxID=3365617 RepID=UPI003790684E